MNEETIMSESVTFVIQRGNGESTVKQVNDNKEDHNEN